MTNGYGEAAWMTQSCSIFIRQEISQPCLMQFTKSTGNLKICRVDVMWCAWLKCEECRKPHRDDPTKNKRFRLRNAAWLMLRYSLMDPRSFIDNFFLFSPREPRDFGSSGWCFAWWRNLCSSELTCFFLFFFFILCVFFFYYFRTFGFVQCARCQKNCFAFYLEILFQLNFKCFAHLISLRRLRVWHEINWVFNVSGAKRCFAIHRYLFFFLIIFLSADDKRRKNPCWTFPRCSIRAMSIENPFARNFATQEIEKQQQIK